MHPARYLLLALVVSLATACSDTSGLRDPVNPTSPTPPTPPPAATLKVDYRVTGDIPNTEITFFTSTQGTTEVTTDLPWTVSYTSADLHPFLYLAAAAPSTNFTNGTVDVQIFVNGVLFREARGSGFTISGCGKWRSAMTKPLVTGARRLVWTVAMVQALTVPCAAQGPIARSVEKAAKQYAQTTTVYSTGMRSPEMFWSGVTLVAGGAVVDIAAVTWAKESDLTHEDINTRLNRDIAPCGTDPTVTRLPVADCKPNTGLLILGSALAVGGGLLMVVGGQTVQITQITPHSISARVRF